MSDEDFKHRKSELVNSDAWDGFLGIKHGTQYHTKAGVSSLYSGVYFLSEVDEEELQELPDYILSDTLEKDVDSTVVACAFGLKETKYLPSTSKVGGQHGALPEGEREGAYIRGWEDFAITGADGVPLYTRELLDAAEQSGENSLGTAFWLIVKDICDSGDFLSQDWYRARIIYEYFREYPVPAENAYLIGELFKELCTKQMFEGDLKAYYQGLVNAQSGRKAGTESTRAKAEELRSYCVSLFVKIAQDQGPRFMLAPDEVKATELRSMALAERRDDFLRAGKPYSKEWFLRHIIENRRLEIVEALEKPSTK